MSVLAPTPAEPAYEALAPHYDDFTAHHDYDSWTGRLLALASHHGLHGAARLLDVGCGTGKSFIPLLARGWEVTAVDLSEAMLERCRAKVGDAVALHHLDVRRLPELGQFELVWALGDIVNYVDEPPDLIDMLRGMATNLAPGGLIVFDANTLNMYRSFFAETAIGETDRVVTVWRGLVEATFSSGALAEARLDVFERAADAWERSSSVHFQRHHPEQLVREALASAGLQCLGAYGQHADASFDEWVDEQRHTKAIYLATNV